MSPSTIYWRCVRELRVYGIELPLLLESVFWGALKNRKEYLRHPILPPHPKAGEEFLENSSLSPLVSSMHGNTSVSFAGM
jgi:hypothetical protein